MMKLTFLGTCSGTEPMPGRHHSSAVLEINGTYYWFDAGENCSHRAYLSGINMARVRAVFITHMHIDHIGGLANLIFTIYKVAERTRGEHINNNSYDIFVPDLELLHTIESVAGAYTPPEAIRVKSVGHKVLDGVVFEDENVRVTALHNRHLRETGENGWHSYSYLVEAEGKRIVFSGDILSPEELDPFTCRGCDLLIMETGHHAVKDICEYAKARGAKKLLFTHHGREILGNVEGVEARLAAESPNARVCHDGDEVIL